MTKIAPPLLNCVMFLSLSACDDGGAEADKPAAAEADKADKAPAAPDPAEEARAQAERQKTAAEAAEKKKAETRERTLAALEDLGDYEKRPAAVQTLKELGSDAAPILEEAAKAALLVYDTAAPKEKFDALKPILAWKEACPDVGEPCLPLLKTLAQHKEIGQTVCPTLTVHFDLLCVADGTFTPV